MSILKVEWVDLIDLCDRNEHPTHEDGFAPMVPVVRLEAVRDAIEKMVGIIPHQHCRTCNQFAEELQSLFYILKEPS